MVTRSQSLQRATLELIVDVVFGVAEANRRERLLDLLPKLSRAATPILFVPALGRDLGPGSPGRRFKRLVSAIDAELFAEIEAHRRAIAGGEGPLDILSALVEACDEDGVGMDDLELRDELMTLLFAGHETTATAITWATLRLAHSPATQVRLEGELAAGGSTYLDAVIAETHRPHPTVPNVVRELTEPTRVEEWLLPAGVVVSPAMHLVHRRPELYPYPQSFRPERWLSTEADSYSFLPFGGGIRRCIGASLAQLEMREMLRAICRRFELRPPDGAALEAPRRRTVTQVPAHGGRIVAVDR